MARKRATKDSNRVRESQEKSQIREGIDMVNPVSTVVKTKSRMNREGIPHLNFDDADELENFILSLAQSIQELIQGSRQKSQLNDWLNVMADPATRGTVRLEENRASTIERIWGDKNVDKVIPLKKGIFLIRFLNNETKEKALNAWHVMFDKRPVFLKQWEDGMELSADEFTRVPVWVQLPKLPLKYWGKSYLEKIVCLIGTPIRPDLATQMKDRVSYARYLVEIDVNGQFDEIIEFVSEIGTSIQQQVVYEWNPVKCDVCKNMGHEVKDCRKGKKVWKPKVVQGDVPVPVKDVLEKKDNQEDKEGWVASHRKTRSVLKSNAQIPTRNAFDGLQHKEVLFGDLNGHNVVVWGGVLMIMIWVLFLEME
ncbi:uncharacterized protein LOC110727631 [Chenopodium quinoa]|uniref:uncharacterized protein LOC110727631 n=1 Tax=Chenopodium quinoa TaxID=63459 RepID=UPI000B7794E7|nr:uncharacterized protein LOC110727631 [Chenopodium quinoa]